MPQIKVGEKTIEVDDNGFIVDPDDWNMEVAHVLAERSALGPLVEDHWKVIVFVREYYEKYKTAPMLRAISKRTNFAEKKLRTLFPRGCRECMCLIAGLPQPTG
jgi:TusE/DsrC/DsvC family sulfur relay protein